MAQEKKMVEAITSMEEDFAQWYTDVVKKADMIAYSSVKGCMIIKPLGYAIWENIQNEADRMFKETGVENVYMPMFIPESLLQKEKDHRNRQHFFRHPAVYVQHQFRSCNGFLCGGMGRMSLLPQKFPGT